jgi:hypothetical protein
MACRTVQGSIQQHALQSAVLRDQTCGLTWSRSAGPASKGKVLDHCKATRARQTQPGRTNRAKSQAAEHSETVVTVASGLLESLPRPASELQI